MPLAQLSGSSTRTTASRFFSLHLGGQCLGNFPRRTVCTCTWLLNLLPAHLRKKQEEEAEREEKLERQ